MALTCRNVDLNRFPDLHLPHTSASATLAARRYDGPGAMARGARSLHMESTVDHVRPGPRPSATPAGRARRTLLQSGSGTRIALHDWGNVDRP